MLATQQPVLRRFWYPTLALEALRQGPQPFELLGEKVVLWQDEGGTPVALEDRCPHRSVPLSNDGRVIDGTLQCGYHGWRFNSEGACTLVPQSPGLDLSKRCRVKSYQCTVRYGFVWVCLEEPLEDIPHIPEAFDPSYRLVPEYAEVWQASAFRVAENALDIAHVSFVHRQTFGDEQEPVSPKLKVTALANGVEINTRVPVANYEEQQRNLNIPDDKTVRIVTIKWLRPSTFLLHFTYPNGLKHLIVGFATPMTDHSCYRIQFCLRNDTEADAPAEAVAAFDRAVGREDRKMLESAHYDFPLDLRAEFHMLLDQPSILMRRQLLQLLKQHGETEGKPLSVV